ncbi:MAG: helicase-associated domain-containing protein, partial [Planctomycetaceae bacterium]|nr:helicase-associated domain-containing protein [Planctomycetaceae bacterium]
MARWDAKWHTLSPGARLAYLKDVKVPQRAPSPHQKRPSVKADRFAASVLKELLAAGFVELGDSGSTGPRDRVFAVVAASDFATRVRARYRHHLLRGDLPSLLETYVRYSFYPMVADELDSVLRHAGVQESLNLDETLRLYVVGHRWPGWVARSLKDPAAERIVELLRDANGPVRRAELEKKLPDIAADKLQAALGSLITHLAVFEDLDPETFELVVGFLPSVRASMAAALLPRERPPLVVSENLQTIGPEGSIIVDDLRAFLLEVVAEPPRLRQDDQIFQNDLDRFLEALGELPSSLMHALGLTQEKRLNQAQDWAQGLALVGKRIQPKRRQLEISPRGSQWLSSSLKEQYSQVYDFLRPVPSDRGGFDPRTTYISSIDWVYGGRESDYRFLGANVTSIKTRPDRTVRYWDAKSKDHEALRESIHRSFAALPLGVFHSMENVLDHLVFEQYNPLLLGLAHERVAVFEHGRSVPPLVERREQAARALLTDLIRKRLIPLGCVQAAIDADGNLCIARHRRLGVYFGHEDNATETAGQAATQTRVVVQPDFSIIIIGLNPAPAAELISFCEREKHVGHGAMTLRLTRESVVKAVAYGMKPAEIVDRLRRLATNEVPANVLRQVS